MNDLINIEDIVSRIYVIRGVKVMLDRDLAGLYQVETKVLKRNVRLHIDRFPDDFMFVLTKGELNNWRSQFGTSNSIKMGLRYPPMAFTEQGVAMLSGVLNSKRAIQVNVQVMRAFVKLRRFILDNEALRSELEELKKLIDDRFQIVFEALDRLISNDKQPNIKIGFIDVDD